MVDTTPLPADFPAPLDADKLPVHVPHPMEAWAEPSPAFEQPISRSLPGGGHVTATRTALENYARAEEQGRRMMAPVRHASRVEAEQRQAEAEVESARKAGDPQAVLKAAHALQAEARAEYERIAPLVTRARDLVRDLEKRVGEQSTGIMAGEAAAAARLIEALAAGEDPPPIAQVVDVTPSIMAAELQRARAALAQLEGRQRPQMLASTAAGMASAAVP
jgi:hypothetical protein